MEMELAHVGFWADGTLKRLEEYSDLAEALEIAGLGSGRVSLRDD
jgi:hypothetical protein